MRHSPVSCLMVSRPMRRAALCGGASLIALMAAGAPRAAAGPFRSLGQGLAAQAAGLGAAGAAFAPTASNNGQAQAQIGLQNLARATARIRGLQASLAAQAAAAAGRQPTGGIVPDGVAVGGLNPVPGYNGTGATAWQGVQAGTPLVQSVSGGRTVVTVNQAKPAAILNWQTFNVGARTTLKFNQAATNWTVLNRVEDPDAAPSTILGAITAPGQVLVLNPNGVLFGAGAQVNLHSLVAGAANIDDSVYLATGIVQASNSAPPVFTMGAGGVTVAAGATLATAAPTNATEGGGSVILLGSTVANDGSIATPQGQAILASGKTLSLATGLSVASVAGGTNKPSTTLGLVPTIGAETNKQGFIQGTGYAVTNTGLIQAATGDVTLIGETVTQAGAVLSSSSVTQRGTIHLLTPGNAQNATITLAPGSVTQIEPETGATTATDGAQAAAYATTAVNGSILDQTGYSRIEITTGGVVHFAADSLTLANGGQIVVTAALDTSRAAGGSKPALGGGRIVADAGAAIDVSGLNGVPVSPMENVLAVSVEPFNLRDAPVNRDTGALNSQTVYLDTRDLVTVPASPAYPTDRLYTAGGLLEVSGEAANQGHTAQEWYTVGGRITLTAPEIVSAPGSVFNVAGGSEQVASGFVPRTYLTTPDGTLYDVNTAPANLVYSGVYSGTKVIYPRWNITDTYRNTIAVPTETMEQGYLVGRDAGRLVLNPVQVTAPVSGEEGSTVQPTVGGTPAVVFDGTIAAGVAIGTTQTASRPATVADPFTLSPSTMPMAGTLALGLSSLASGALPTAPLPLAVTIGEAPAALPEGYTADQRLGDAYDERASFGAAQLDGLGGLLIQSGQRLAQNDPNGSIAVTAPLTLAPGGTLSLAAPSIALDADVTVRGGTVSAVTAITQNGAAVALANRGVAVTLAPGVVIDARGEWVNTIADPSATAGLAVLNGGRVSLESTQELLVPLGSAIDVSSGGAVTPQGQRGGAGGSITLVGDDPVPVAAAQTGTGGTPIPGNKPLQGPAEFAVRVDGTLSALGVSGGGTFTLEAPSIVVGSTSPVALDQVVLPAGFFDAGFGAYVLDGFAPPVVKSADQPGGVTVLPDTRIAVVEPTLAFGLGSDRVPGGSDPRDELAPVLLPLFQLSSTGTFTQRPGASLVLESVQRLVSAPSDTGTIVLGEGSAIAVDPGQSVTLSAANQITVDGTITAQGGTIALLNTFEVDPIPSPTEVAGLSIWVGGGARLDASGYAVSGVDASGALIGSVTNGGSIVIGSAFSTLDPSLDPALAPDAFVFVRPGAVLDASGAQVTASYLSGQATQVASIPGQAALPAPVAPHPIASNGGLISLSSSLGIYQDGTERAAAGGAGAAGGTLAIDLETPFFGNGRTQIPTPDWIFQPHRTILSEAPVPDLLAPDLQPGDSGFLDYTYLSGFASVSQQQLAAGGFGSLFVQSRDQITYNGNVSLQLPVSVTLSALTQSDLKPDGVVVVQAPHVVLSSFDTRANPSGEFQYSPILGPAAGNPNFGNNNLNGLYSKSLPPCTSGQADCYSARLTVEASVIDIAGSPGLGGAYLSYDTGQGKPVYYQKFNFAGFDRTELVASQDVRFVPSANGKFGTFGGTTTPEGLPLQQDALTTGGDLTIVAAQVYPSTGTSGTLTAGVNYWGSNDALQKQQPDSAYYYGGVLEVRRNSDAPVQPPLSAFGQLTLAAATVEQGGTLLAPFGVIAFGGVSPTVASGGTRNAPVLTVDFLPGSMTSVSGDGLTVPYGGTTDGINYGYGARPSSDGSATFPGYFTLQGAALGDAGAIQRVVIGQIGNPVNTARIEAGAVIDIAGGGTLAGGGGEIQLSSGGTFTSQGFISGRGGSVDVLYAPLPTFNPASRTVSNTQLASNPVYAILPGYTADYAPETTLDVAGTPGSPVAFGAQVAIGAGVPGLPAGTYTLLPGYYALLPGAYRVQFNSGPATLGGRTVSLNNGSYATTGFAASALAGVQSAVGSTIVVTPGSVVRTYASYDEEGFSDFAVAAAAQFGVPRPYIPADAGVFDLELAGVPSGKKGRDAGIAFTDDGVLESAPAAGGYGSTVAVDAKRAVTSLEILSPGSDPTAGDVSIAADSLDALDASVLLVGGTAQYGGGYGAPNAKLQPTVTAVARNVTLRSGAVLSAPTVFLTGSSVTLAPGSTVEAIGAGSLGPDSAVTGLPYVNVSSNGISPSGFVVASAGSIALSPSQAGGSIAVGGCADACSGSPVRLYASGSLGVSAGTVTIADGTRFGARDLTLASTTISLGTVPDGQTGQGLVLSPAVLDALFAGGQVPGVPALASLRLTAADAIDFYGSGGINTIDPATGRSSLGTLVLNTPTIEGAGGPDDVAVIDTGALVWTTVPGAPPGPVVADGPGTGTGTLAITAGSVTFGYPAGVNSQDQTTLTELALGFSTVSITGTASVSGNNHVSLSAYASRGAWDPATAGWTYSGGDLSIATPLLTTAPGAVLGLAAGGNVTLSAGAGAPSAATGTGFGGEIDISAGGAISDATAIVLDGGKAVLHAAGDVSLAAGARLDLSGPLVPFFGVTRPMNGGTAQLASDAGSIDEAAGASIDVSSEGAVAGTISATAAGSIALGGAVLGAGPSADLSGSVTLQAASLGGLDALDAVLDAGGLFYARNFTVTGPGDAAIAGTLTAEHVAVTVDQGQLTVSGTIAASGPGSSSIRLMASNGLTLAAGSVLDAHNTALHADSYGNAIDSESAPRVELGVTGNAQGVPDAGTGTLLIGAGAVIDVSQPDGGTRGDVELDVPRLGPTGGDAAVSAGGPVTIRGAGTIALNAFWTYAPQDPNAPAPSVGSTAGGVPILSGGTITQATLDAIDTDSLAWMGAAVQGGAVTGALAGKVSGLSAYGAAFHVRPGVEIDGRPDVAGGDLTISGDIDLSRYRYDGVTRTGSTYGSGEPGVLWLRASGNLNVYGSLTDGFAPPPATPDDDGWVLKSGQDPNGQTDIVTAPVTLNKGSTIATGDYSLGYAVTVRSATLAAGAPVPVDATLASAFTLKSDYVVNGTITVHGRDGDTTYVSGEVIPAGTTLKSGTALAAGTVLPNQGQPVSIKGADGGALTLAAGTDLAPFGGNPLTLSAAVTLAAGDAIPAGSDVVLPRKADSVSTRPQDATEPDGTAVQGLNWAVAPLLPAGDLSWSLRLVGGADLASADSRAVQTPAALAAAGSGGAVVLSDQHYMDQEYDDPSARALNKVVPNQLNFSVIRTGTGDLDLVAAGDFTEASRFGIYTAGAQAADVSPEFEAPRPVGPDGTVLGSSGDVTGPAGSTYNAVAAQYLAYYPTGGGNLFVQVGGTATGDVVQAQVTDKAAITPTSNDTSQWLWWQGGDGSTAWWINFGQYVGINSGGKFTQPYVAGFTGFGALGGGSATVQVGGDAGTVQAPQDTSSQGLDVAVGSTGRVSGTLVAETGGGSLDLSVGGAINPGATAPNRATLAIPGLYGVAVDTRGTASVTAASIGESVLAYQQVLGDPRPTQFGLSQTQNSTGGIEAVLGDAALTVATRGDLVFQAVGNPTLETQLQPVQLKGTAAADSERSVFSLWTGASALSLASAGGDVVPSETGLINDSSASDSSFGNVVFSNLNNALLYPPRLEVTAFGGSLYLSEQNTTNATGSSQGLPIELVPSATGTIGLFAEGSIFNGSSQGTQALPGAVSILISGADPSVLATPFQPALSSATSTFTQGGLGLFAFGNDTASGSLHAGGEPARFYAETGDVVGLITGTTITLLGTAPGASAAGIVAAVPVQIEAGRDVLFAGPPQQGLQGIAGAPPDIFLNDSAGDISVIEAGRDVIYPRAEVAGPGLLLVQAGRNVTINQLGQLLSVGPVGPGAASAGLSSGAGITVLAGVGAGPDYADFAKLYLDPANLANPSTPLQDQPGKVVRTYQDQLLAFLQQRFGYTGTQADALATFLTLPIEQQADFLLGVYFAELNQSGLDHNNPGSRFYQSYLEGDEAIRTLFPATDFSGLSAPDGGGLSLFSARPPGSTFNTSTNVVDGSIRTLAGGSIRTVVPFGETVLGNFGIVPGSTAGILTQGSGDIDMYSYGSVILGQSRVLTTFGGSILIWMSSDGQINAGRGSKSTVINAPVGISYDAYGNVIVSPAVPSNGAGIGALAPIPSVPAGDVNLVAPVGTIDAGEAGIRASGNANLAALAVVNGSNIQTGGRTVGVPTVTVASATAAAAASASAGSAAQAAQETRPKAPLADQATVIEVDVLSISSTGGGGSGDQDRRKRGGGA